MSGILRNLFKRKKKAEDIDSLLEHFGRLSAQVTPVDTSSPRAGAVETEGRSSPSISIYGNNDVDKKKSEIAAKLSEKVDIELDKFNIPISQKNRARYLRARSSSSIGSAADSIQTITSSSPLFAIPEFTVIDACRILGKEIQVSDKEEYIDRLNKMLENRGLDERQDSILNLLIADQESRLEDNNIFKYLKEDPVIQCFEAYNLTSEKVVPWDIEAKDLKELYIKYAMSPPTNDYKDIINREKCMNDLGGKVVEALKSSKEENIKAAYQQVLNLVAAQLNSPLYQAAKAKQEIVEEDRLKTDFKNSLLVRDDQVKRAEALLAEEKLMKNNNPSNAEERATIERLKARDELVKTLDKPVKPTNANKQP